MANGVIATQVRVAPLPLPAPGFEKFTFPRYRGLLLGTETPETTQERFALGAWLGETPVGLAFYSRSFGEEKNRRLLSVMVSPLMRRQGIATRLFAQGENLARELGAKKITTIHSSQMQAFAAFEALLRKAGWDAPKELEYRLAGKASWAVQAQGDWAPFLARLGKRGFSVSAWTEMTEADREEIRKVVESSTDEAGRAFDPFKQNEDFQALVVPELSVLLRRDGQIAGWIIGARGLAANTYHYSSGYAVPSVRRAGWLIGGVWEVCRRQAELFGGESISVFETSPQNQGMRRLMDRQLKLYSVWTDARYISEKRLDGQ
ncbi:MAG: GNAT family N-acetyltransferase [Burkholderiales bacterium]